MYTIPDWTRAFVTATTLNDAGQTITQHTGWRAALDPTHLRRYPTADEWDLSIVADDALHGPGQCGTDCHEQGSAANLCLMSVPDGSEEDVLTAANAAIAGQGFRVDGDWHAGPNGTATAELVPVILDPASEAYEPETAASLPQPAGRAHPPMRFCRCGQYANRIFTPLDPETGEPDEAATFYRCPVHAYDPDVPQQNVRQRSVCWRGVQFGPDPLCLEPMEYVGSGEGVISGWYHVDRRITRDHHALNRI